MSTACSDGPAQLQHEEDLEVLALYEANLRPQQSQHVAKHSARFTVSEAHACRMAGMSCGLSQSFSGGGYWQVWHWRHVVAGVSVKQCATPAGFRLVALVSQDA